MARVAHFLCLAVLAALYMTSKHGQVVVAHDQVGCLFRHARFHFHAKPGREVCRLFARNAQAAGEHCDRTGEWPGGICRRQRLCRKPAFCYGEDQFVKRYGQPGFGMEHYESCGAGIFTGIVMVKVQVESALEVREPVTAVPLQLGPCPPRNRDAVAPAKVWLGDAAETTGCVYGLLVEIAVLDEMMPC